MRSFWSVASIASSEMARREQAATEQWSESRRTAAAGIKLVLVPVHAELGRLHGSRAPAADGTEGIDTYKSILSVEQACSRYMGFLSGMDSRS